VRRQNYPAIRLIIGCDDRRYDEVYGPLADLYVQYERPKVEAPIQERFFPHLYANTLAAKVQSGYILHLDDDERFSFPFSAARIMSVAEDDALVRWRVTIGDQTVGEPDHLEFGCVTGCGFAYPVSALEHATWTDDPLSDAHVARRLAARLKSVFLDEILTEAQRSWGWGKNQDF
jgi:hypothetical protein